VSKRTYHPQRGDLILINFQPAAGREIDKRRPAVVLSRMDYNRASGLCICVPVTSDLTPDPLAVRIPDGLLDRPGLVLCDRIKSFDYRERSATRLGSIPQPLFDEIIAAVLDLLDPTD
jgi:mRNA interferase MazF